MLDRASGYYFLQKRIFSDLSATASAPASPSGSVPGGDRNGRSCRFSIGGDEQGLDRFFAISSRVLVVKVMGQAVISLFFGVLHVIVYLPPY
jgi:hypothetical protein